MAEQQEVVIVDKNGTEHVFPPGFDPQKAAQIVRRQMLGTPELSVPTALALRATGALMRPAANAAMDFATSPTAWKTGGNIGEVGGGLVGLAKAGPLGAATGMYAGKRAGWRLANAMQRMTGAVAPTLEAAAPYAQAVNTVSGAQGFNDLAQMAEPNRKDIGFMGIGATPQGAQPIPSLIDALRNSNPAIKALIDEIMRTATLR